jgi:putative FmdB family regulatory protein
MPLYEHRCERCTRITDTFSRMDSDKEIPCKWEGCGGTAVRIMSVPGYRMDHTVKGITRTDN